METMIITKISTLVLAMTVQSLITIKWQEKKLPMIKIFNFFVSDHLKSGSYSPAFGVSYDWLFHQFQRDK